MLRPEGLCPDQLGCFRVAEIMETSTAIYLSMALPALGVILNLIMRHQADLRETVTFGIALCTFLSVLCILANEGSGSSETFVVLSIMPSLDISFNVEPLGLLFAVLASGLWMVTHLYGIGYMRGNNEKDHARFFACFSFAIFSVMGIAFSANMFTLFLFYEALTVSTYPLVAHKGTPEAIKGARTYLAILMGSSICIQMVAIIWTYAITGTLDFTMGGILEGQISHLMAAILLALYAFGIGKAALMPFHTTKPIPRYTTYVLKS